MMGYILSFRFSDQIGVQFILGCNPRRRERVIQIFPNEASAKRLISAVLVEIHEAWQSRRYLEMDTFHEWWQAIRDKAPQQKKMNKAED